MKLNKYMLLIIWAGMYVLCAVLGFLPPQEGANQALLVVMALLFFLPPAVLLYRAIPREQWGTVRLIRNLSAASLFLTAVVLILNFLSVGSAEAVGDVLYAVLILVSVPMVCMQSWIASLFLWAVLLMVTLKYRKKK